MIPALGKVAKTMDNTESLISCDFHFLGEKIDNKHANTQVIFIQVLSLG